MTTTTPSLVDCELANIRHTGDHRLSLRFNDGLVADLSFTGFGESGGPLRQSLNDSAFFAQAYLDHGILTWPNGYDIDPVTLRAWAERGFAG